MATAAIGTGTTVGFSVSTAFLANLLAVNGTGMTRAVIEAGYLAATGFIPKLFGDLTDAGEVGIEMEWDPSHVPPIAAAAQTMTITLPDRTGFSINATIAGTGAITAWDYQVPLEDRMVGSFTWTWNAGTGPAYTDYSNP